MSRCTLFLEDWQSVMGDVNARVKDIKRQCNRYVYIMWLKGLYYVILWEGSFFSKMGGLLYICLTTKLDYLKWHKCFPFENCTHMFTDLICRKCGRLHVNEGMWYIHGECILIGHLSLNLVLEPYILALNQQI